MKQFKMRWTCSMKKILTVISAATAGGRDTAALGLFKERSLSVPTTPHSPFTPPAVYQVHKTGVSSSLSLLYSAHTSSVTHIHDSISFQSLLLSLSYLPLSVFFLSSSSSFFFPSHSSAPCSEPSRERVGFFSPSSSSSSIWQLTADQEGSRFLIPKTCPSMDTPLPLAGDQQLSDSPWCCETSTSPNYIPGPLQRGCTSRATPPCVWYTCSLLICAHTHVSTARDQPPDLKVLQPRIGARGVTCFPMYKLISELSLKGIFLYSGYGLFLLRRSVSISCLYA